MNRFNTGYPELERIIDDDLSELLSQVDHKWGLDVSLIDLNIYELGFDDYEEFYDYQIVASFRCEGLEFSISFHVKDPVDGSDYIFDDITIYDVHDAYMHRYYMSMNQQYDAQDFSDRIKNRGNIGIESATSITAADEDDPFADMGFDEPDDPEGGEGTALSPEESDDSISDNIDDMNDTLDDLSDALQDFEEDNVDIDIENNIGDHFIAECEKCHGVFITSVVESDQEIEKISGTCPLCDEECDQYLKWVIKEL